MNESDHLTLYKMMTGRGSFEWHLAHACQFAAPEQFAAIKHALPDVFEKYRPPGIATPPKVSVPTPCPGCKHPCDGDGKCRNTGCVFGPDDDGTATPWPVEARVTT